MNSNSTNKTTISILVIAILLISLNSQGQSRYAQSSTRITISGTSSLHDWTMKSESSTCDAVFQINSQGEPLQLVSMVVSVPSESLKSGKSGMDKNAYSALKADKNKDEPF